MISPDPHVKDNAGNVFLEYMSKTHPEITSEAFRKYKDPNKAFLVLKDAYKVLSSERTMDKQPTTISEVKKYSKSSIAVMFREYFESFYNVADQELPGRVRLAGRDFMCDYSIVALLKALVLLSNKITYVKINTEITDVFSSIVKMVSTADYLTTGRFLKEYTPGKSSFQKELYKVLKGCLEGVQDVEDSEDP
jgi:hypothetical protein